MIFLIIASRFFSSIGRSFFLMAMFPLMVESALTKHLAKTLVIYLGAVQVNAAIQDNFVNIS